MRVGLVLVFGLMAYGVNALWCYESDHDTGRLRARDCPECKYCVIASTGLIGSSSTVFGMGNDSEDLSVYQPIFDQGHDSNGAYKVMSTCVLERYVMGFKEYFFRCFCNEDFCNKATDIPSFLSNMVERDMRLDS